MREIAKVRVRYGYRKIRVLLNREGWNVSRYLAYGRAAAIDAERRSHAGSGFVPRLRTRFGVWILWPTS